MERNIKLKVGFEFDDVKAQAKQKAEEAKQEIQKSLDGVDTSKINSDIDKSTEKLGEMSEKVDEVKEKINATDLELEPELKTENIEQQVEAIQNEVQNTLDGVDTSNVDAEIQQNIDKLQELSAKIDEVKAKLNTMRNDTVDLSDADFNRKYGDDANWAEQYNELEEQLKSLNGQMDVELVKQKKMQNGFSQVGETASEATGKIFNGFSQSAEHATDAAESATTAGSRIAQSMEGAGAAAGGLSSSILGVVTASGGLIGILGLVIGLIVRLVQAIQQAVQAMAELQGRMARMLVNSVPILKQVVGIVTKPKETIQNLGSFRKQLRGALKKLLSSAVGVLKNGISKAVGDIKSSISEGIGALEQWQIAMGNTSNSISALKGSLELLKMNIGAAFAPILDAAAPALLQLISILNQATITIGSFFAALGGKTKILVAKSATASLTNASTAAGDVASAASDSTDSLGTSYQALEKVGKGADTAAGKLNNFLGSYDELNVIGKESGGGGGAGGGADLSANFEEIEIGEDILDFAEKVREAWKKADFTELGQEIGQKLIDVLNEADEWINKNGIPFAEKFGKSLATLINGFVTAKELDENGNETGRTIGQVIGQTIADGIEMVLTGIESFLSTINAPEVGQFVVDIIKKFLDPDEGGNNKTMWDSLGNVIVLGINKAIEFGNTLLNPDNDVFQKFGENVRDLIKKAVEGDEKTGEDGIKFNELGEMIANGIGSAVEFVMPILESRKTFYTLGTKLGTALNSLQDGMDDNQTWEKLGTVLINGMKDVFLVLGGFLDTWDPSQLADGLARAVNTAISNLTKEDAQYFVSTLYRLSITLKDLLERFISQINADELGQTLAGAIEGMNIEAGMASFSRLAHTIVGKLLDTLIATVKTLQEDGQFENFGAQVYNGMSSVDWSDIIGKIFELLKRLSDVGLQAMGGFLKEAIKGVLRNVVSTVVDFFLAWMPENVREKIKDQINSDLGLLPTEASAAAVDAGKVIAGDFTHGLIGTTEEELNNWPNSTVSTQLENSKTTNGADATSTGEEIGNSLASGAINTTEEKLKDWPNSIVSENLETANTTADTKVDEIKKTITGGLDETKTESGDILDKLRGAFTGTFEDINAGVNGQGGSMPKLKQGVSTTTEEIKNDTVQKVQQMSTDTQNAYNEMKENTVGSNGSFTAMKDKASTIAAGLKTDVSKEVSDLGSNVQSSTSVDIKQVTIEAFEEMAKKVAGNSENDTSAIVPKVKDVIIKCFEEMQKKVVDTGGIIPDFKQKMIDAFNELQSKLVGADGNGGIMNVIKISIIGAATNMKTSLLEQYNEAQSNLKNFVNSSITYINQLIAAYNALRVAMSAVGAGVGGTPTPAVPHLAQGAVIPPNQPFLAMLGDQKSGTNIEAPLSTIQEAVANVLEPYLAEIATNTKKTADKDLTVRIGDRDIARSATRGQRMMGLKIRTV